MNNLTLLKSTYPNALAKLKISLKDMSIKQVCNFHNDCYAVKKYNKYENANINKTHMHINNDQRKTANTNEIEQIWKNLSTGNINISYACIGYTLDGRPIINQDEFVNLLINYGFTMPAIMDFINDFASQALNDNKSPIIMYTVNTVKIMTEIKPIKKKKK